MAISLCSTWITLRTPFLKKHLTLIVPWQVSTLEAATSGSLSGAEGFTTQEDQEMLNRIEKQLKRRFAIGSQVSEDSIVKDFVKQKYPEPSVQKVIYFMIRRGELQHRMQRKMLYRLKWIILRVRASSMINFYFCPTPLSAYSIFLLFNNTKFKGFVINNTSI